MGTQQEENNLKNDKSPAEELFGVTVLASPILHDGVPKTSAIQALLEDEEVRAIGFCEACGSTFGIIQAGMEHLLKGFNLSLQNGKEAEYVSLPTCATCKYRPSEDVLPVVKAF